MKKNPEETKRQKKGSSKKNAAPLVPFLTPFAVPPLPYAPNALFLSENTVRFHYTKHTLNYTIKLNNLVEATGFAYKTLEDIIKTSADAIFNNAAQVWNHAFYFRGLSPTIQTDTGPLGAAIADIWGSVEAFQSLFLEFASGLFGSGWCWLVLHNNRLTIVNTSNADNPMCHGYYPIWACDVWEHAYYLDFKNNRGDYIKQCMKHINWEFANDNFKGVPFDPYPIHLMPVPPPPEPVEPPASDKPKQVAPMASSSDVVIDED
jgi:superoxide dismutase, Fe-Mn family